MKKRAATSDDAYTGTTDVSPTTKLSSTHPMRSSRYSVDDITLLLPPPPPMPKSRSSIGSHPSGAMQNANAKPSVVQSKLIGMSIPLKPPSSTTPAPQETVTKDKEAALVEPEALPSALVPPPPPPPPPPPTSQLSILKVPKGIISLSIGATRTIQALGLTNRLVSISAEGPSQALHDGGHWPPPQKQQTVISFWRSRSHISELKEGDESSHRPLIISLLSLAMRFLRAIFRQPPPPPSQSRPNSPSTADFIERGVSWSFDLTSLKALSEVYRTAEPSKASSSVSSGLPHPSISLIVLPNLSGMHHTDKSLINVHVIQRFAPPAPSSPSSPSSPSPSTSKPPEGPQKTPIPTSIGQTAPPSSPSPIIHLSPQHPPSSPSPIIHLSPQHPLITSGILTLPPALPHTPPKDMLQKGEEAPTGPYLPQASPSSPLIMHHDCSSLSDVYHFIADLGHALDASDQAVALVNSMKSSFAAIATAAHRMREVQAVTTRVLLIDRVFQVKGRGWRLSVSRADCRPAWLNEITKEVLGLEDAIDDEERPSTNEISWEEVADCSPDFIVFLTPSSSSLLSPLPALPSLSTPLSLSPVHPPLPTNTQALPDDLSRFLQHVAESGQWWNLPAVSLHGKVATVDRSLLLEAGPDLVKGAQTLSSLAAYPQRPGPALNLTLGLADGFFSLGRKGQVMKLSLEGGQRCRSSQLSNHFTPFPS